MLHCIGYLDRFSLILAVSKPRFGEDCFFNPKASMLLNVDFVTIVNLILRIHDLDNDNYRFFTGFQDWEGRGGGFDKTVCTNISLLFCILYSVPLYFQQLYFF